MHSALILLQNERTLSTAFYVCGHIRYAASVYASGLKRNIAPNYPPFIIQQWSHASDEEKNSLKKFHLQGSLIVQTLMKLPEEHNSIVVSRLVLLH